MKPTVVVFVKTLGQSPLKTRLAKEIGEDQAHRFYELSVSAIEAVIKQQADLNRCTGLWAVAEPEAHKSWHGLGVMSQGDGDLGARLSKVYNEVMTDHDACVLMAADSPQISAAIMEALWQALHNVDFVVGPAIDGGFYLLAGKRPIPSEVWMSVPYSHPDTLVLLREKLSALGSILDLPTLADVDYASDLLSLYRALAGMHVKTSEQSMLLIWLEEIVSKFSLDLAQ